MEKVVGKQEGALVSIKNTSDVKRGREKDDSNIGIETKAGNDNQQDETQKETKKQTKIKNKKKHEHNNLQNLILI